MIRGLLKCINKDKSDASICHKVSLFTGSDVTERSRWSHLCHIWKQVRGSSPAYMYLGREYSRLICWRSLAAEGRKTGLRWFEHVADGLGFVSPRSTLIGDVAVEIMSAFRKGRVRAQEPWTLSRFDPSNAAGGRL